MTTVLFFQIFSLSLKEGCIFHPPDIRPDHRTCFSQYNVTALLSRRAYELMLCCPALFLTHEIREIPETSSSANIPDDMKQRHSWPLMDMQFERKPNLCCCQCWDFRVTAQPASRARAPGGVRVPAHPLFSVVLNSISPSPTIYMARELIKIKQ